MIQQHSIIWYFKKNGHSPDRSQCNLHLTASLFVISKVISIITAQCTEIPQIPRESYLFIIGEIGTLCSTTAPQRVTGIWVHLSLYSGAGSLSQELGGFHGCIYLWWHCHNHSSSVHLPHWLYSLTQGCKHKHARKKDLARISGESQRQRVGTDLPSFPPSLALHPCSHLKHTVFSTLPYHGRKGRL